MAQTKHRDDQLFVAPVEFDDWMQLNGGIRRALIASGSALTVDPELHDGRTIVLNQADGVAVTLPAATGSGARYRFVVSVTVTSNSDTISAAGTDEFVGSILAVLDNDNADAWQAAAADNFDVITLDGGDQGGLIGDEIIIEDIASGSWLVSGRVVQANATAATPFSST